MAELLAVNPRDFSVLLPDGPVNRHVLLKLNYDPETGAITGEPQLEHARAQALGPDKKLPVEQRPVEGSD